MLRCGVSVVEEKSWICEVSLGCGEVWEYLYHNHTRINHITSPVSITPVSQLQQQLCQLSHFPQVIQLLGNQLVTPPRPGLKIKVSTSPDTTHKVGKERLLHGLTIHHSHLQKPGIGVVETDLDGFVSGLHLNIDLTLLDRVQLLLSQQPSGRQEAVSLCHGASLDPSLDRVKHSLYMTASNINTIQQVDTRNWVYVPGLLLFPGHAIYLEVTC